MLLALADSADVEQNRPSPSFDRPEGWPPFFHQSATVRCPNFNSVITTAPTPICKREPTHANIMSLRFFQNGGSRFGIVLNGSPLFSGVSGLG
jgi:hypothetical protein